MVRIDDLSSMHFQIVVSCLMCLYIFNIVWVGTLTEVIMSKIAWEGHLSTE